MIKNEHEAIRQAAEDLYWQVESGFKMVQIHGTVIRLEQLVCALSARLRGGWPYKSVGEEKP